MYALAPDALVSDSVYCGVLLVAPHGLVSRFGPPLRASGDGKISGSYIFSDGRGNVAVLYDWKSTSLYDGRPEAGLPSVESFWASTDLEQLSLATSGRISISSFAEWLGARAG